MLSRPRRQQDLFRILKAYTIYRPDEGYCQAQAPVAAVLLMHMPAEVRGTYQPSKPPPVPRPPTGFNMLLSHSKLSGAWFRYVRSTSPATTAQDW